MKCQRHQAEAAADPLVIRSAGECKAGHAAETVNTYRMTVAVLSSRSFRQNPTRLPIIANARAAYRPNPLERLCQGAAGVSVSLASRVPQP